MPTYTFKCQTCDQRYEVVRRISDHVANPQPIVCCNVFAERSFEPTGRDAAQDNALAGDRHYDGLVATDGTDISTRTKHREYMKRHGLTTVDDFTDQWAKQQKARDEYRTTGKGGAITRDDIARAIHQGMTR